MADAASEVTTIAVDAMGGDHGPSITVAASIEFLRTHRQPWLHRIILVGKSEALTPVIADHHGADLVQAGLLRLHEASQVVDMDEPPAHAMKKKKDSSMRVAINLVKEGQAQACISAGNTGALMATARFVLKTIDGIDRPAIVSTMPCQNPSNTVHMLDLGANVDSTPEMLVQFAVMGSVLTEYVDKKESPRVALLNVGAEEIKGSEKTKQASTLLAQSKLNYVGYIEANELYSSKVDVIVCDGFEGNVALKASEGTAGLIMNVLREEFGRSWLSKLAGLLTKPILKRMARRIDPRHHNGATLLGLNGIVVKSHGGADQVGFLHALQEANRQAERDVIGHISEEIRKVFNDIN
ncbi:MAG: phosphate acyltransferase PlsX [Gammaproteobacteria bacterium]|nr:phosphate acyltransferase PlsX [Gammaproteobacteria bacterium]